MSSFANVSSSSSPSSGKDEMRQPFEGQLNKFTNVMKGWQYRWFVLNPERGQLEYYLLEERNLGKCRGAQHLAGTLVLPSDEDSQTFNVNFASGDSYKLRAVNVRERQVWVDRLRAVAQMHDRAVAQNNPPLAVRGGGGGGGNDHGHVLQQQLPLPPGARSHIANGEPSLHLQHLSLSLLDAFGSVHDIIHQSQLKADDLCVFVENLASPASGNKPTRLDDDLLILKATANAAVLSLEQGLSILQDYRCVEMDMFTRAVLHPVWR
jgi:hypothetical protein